MSGPKPLKRGELLFREGDPSEAMYVIKTGKIAVLKSKGNSEITLAELGPGDMIGEMAFFDSKPRSASARALADSVLIELPFKALNAQFKTFPEWLKAVMRAVNTHLRNANQKIKSLEKSDEEAENLTGAQPVRRTGVSIRDIDMNRIIKEFSGTLFIIDEFHNLRSGAGVPDSDYTILQTVFDKVPNIKVVGSSATPMFDKAEEIIPSLNLILSKDKRLPVDLDLTDIEYKDFAKYIRGAISYVKSPSSAASPNYIENKEAPVVLKNIPKTFKSTDDEGKEYKGEIYSPVYWIPISKLRLDEK